MIVIAKASIFPTVSKNNSTLVPCLFSCVTYANISTDDLPENSIVVAYGQNQRYYGAFWTHTASSPFLKINTDPVTFIQMVLLGPDKRTMANAILEQRKLRNFTTINELCTFIDKQKLKAALIPDCEQRISFC